MCVLIYHINMNRGMKEGDRLVGRKGTNQWMGGDGIERAGWEMGRGEEGRGGNVCDDGDDDRTKFLGPGVSATVTFPPPCPVDLRGSPMQQPSQRRHEKKW